MEMCYDGALVLPSSYAVMDEEEMCYVDAGGAKMFCSNMKGLWNKTRDYRWAWKLSGISLSTIKASASMAYTAAICKFGAVVVKVAAFLSRVLAAVLTVGAAVAVCYLWNNERKSCADRQRYYYDAELGKWGRQYIF